ncbi:hypothetical protein L204_101930 [Cryptococcus depauperatus]
MGSSICGYKFNGGMSDNSTITTIFLMEISRSMEVLDDLFVLWAGFARPCVSYLFHLLTPVTTLPFLSSSLAFALVYIWSRRNPSIKMSLFGVLTYVVSVGMLAGHTYVFLQDYWPREMWSRTGRPEIRTPAFM